MLDVLPELWKDWANVRYLGTSMKVALFLALLFARELSGSAFTELLLRIMLALKGACYGD